MKIVNTHELPEETWSSPKGKFSGACKGVSLALGRKPDSLDLNERHPFDVEILRMPPGATPYPCHSHSAQWEFYHVITGRGSVRHAGETPPSSREMPSSSGRARPTSSSMTARRTS